MTVSPYDLTTIAAARTFGNIPPSVPDAQIQSLITSWSMLFMTLTLRGTDLIAGQSIVEQRDGTGTDSMTLGHYPVISPLTSLKIGLQVIPLAVYPAWGYVLDSDGQGFLSLVGYIFCKGRGNVTISYNYGYPSIPTDVAQAANEMVLWLLRSRDHIDLMMGILAGQTVRYRDKFPLDVCYCIDRYTRKRRRS